MIREATIEDIDEIVRHRVGMYQAMEVGDSQSRVEMAAAATKLLPEAIANGSFRGWLAVVGGRAIAGGGVFVTPWLSHPRDLICRRATVLNVYTDPEYRRQGIAHRLMEVILEWCRREGFAEVFLHASHEGRPLYEKLGFQAGNEMKLRLR